MPSRPCPVCNTGKVWRPEVRTCSRYCSIIWSSWPPSTQAQAVIHSLNADDAATATNTIHSDDLLPGPDDDDPEMPSSLK